MAAGTATVVAFAIVAVVIIIGFTFVAVVNGSGMKMYIKKSHKGSFTFFFESGGKQKA